MKLTEYVAHDAVGLAELIAKGEVKAEEVKNAALNAIQAVNGDIHAVIESWPDEVCKPGPLHGVPVLVKDLGIAVKGRRNESGSRLAEGYVAPYDSNLIQKMRRAGLLLAGRTSTPELATSTTTEPRFNGGTRNPWNLNFNAGGSSGGAAAAVAAGIVPVAHATDGGGSIRVPASANGLFGLKPSRGRISMGPDVDEVWSGLAVHGFVSRSVRDNAALLDAVQGAVSGDPFAVAPAAQSLLSCVTASPGKLKIGVMAHSLSGQSTSPEVLSEVNKTVSRLTDLGHQVEEAAPDIGSSWEAFVEMNARYWAANTAAWIDSLAAAMQRPVNADTLEPANLALWRLGHKLTAVDLIGAMQMRNAVTQKMAAFFQRYDLLLTPTLPDIPAELGSYNRGQENLDGRGWVHHVFSRSPFTALANICGTPAMSVPLGFDSPRHLPVGMQFFAGFNGEALLLRLAGQLEQAFPWQHRRPIVWAGRQ